MDSETTTKVCTRCGRKLPLIMFGKNNATKDGYQCYCKGCQNEYKKLRRAQKVAEQKALREEAQRIADAMPESDTIQLSDGRMLRKVAKDCKPLSEYDSRELLSELKGRGYVWTDMFVKTRVEYSKI